MLIKKFIIGLLSFYAFDVKRVSLKNDISFHQDEVIEREIETKKKRESEKKKTRLYEKHKWKRKKQYHEQTYKLKGTRPKDHRYSNQQKIRRMFRNS
jgi:Ni/Co efflux regulator RcnB